MGRIPCLEHPAVSAEVQAIRSGRDHLTLANFWTAGEAGGITADGPASVVVGIEGHTIHGLMKRQAFSRPFCRTRCPGDAQT